jgi:hypothetical protein
MRGCLSLPFRLLSLALFAILIFLGYTYRDQIRRWVHTWTADPPGAEGRVDPGVLAGARRKLGQIGSRDSVILSATELATLLASEANARLQHAADSLTVRLSHDQVEVRALVDPRPLGVGPVLPVLRDREWVEAAGRVIYRRPGVAEWDISRAKLRGVPIPHSVIEHFLRQLSGSAAAGTAEIPLPPRVTGLRAESSGLVVYGGRAQ